MPRFGESAGALPSLESDGAGDENRLVGLTNLQAKIIYAAEGDPSIVIHEAIHVKTEEGGHCDWSNRFLDIHNRLEVRGAFTDECDGVRCSSDGTGHNWSCR